MANTNSREARRIYQERYPNRRVPSHQTFASTYRRLRQTGNLNFQEPRVNIRELNVAIDEQILGEFEQNPTTSIRQIAARLGLSKWKVWSVFRNDGRHAFHYTPVQEKEEAEERGALRPEKKSQKQPLRPHRNPVPNRPAGRDRPREPPPPPPLHHPQMTSGQPSRPRHPKDDPSFFPVPFVPCPYGRNQTPYDSPYQHHVTSIKKLLSTVIVELKAIVDHVRATINALTLGAHSASPEGVSPGGLTAPRANLHLCARIRHPKYQRGRRPGEEARERATARPESAARRRNQ
ncbi:unnamed protein product [Diatraea saccharalis]|uniref:DUF4817 domain-containing protein n=1 Tax=Diatraea saccharalis TaxID=40085 RepID=A0A9N9WFD8_9NEOP|nr:unnamed protein product [Diatraea saccharalis]